MRTLFAIYLSIVALYGCDEDRGPASLRQARGPFYASPKHGVAVSVPHDVQTTRALDVVDMRVDEWISQKAMWGCDAYTDEHLAAVARSLPIIVYSSFYVPADGTPNVAGWCNYGIRIEVSWYYDMLQLPHELTHIIRGNWHD